MTRCLPFVALSLAVCLAPSAAAQARPAPNLHLVETRADTVRFVSLGSTYTRWFFRGVDDSLAAVIAAPTLAKMGGKAGLARLRARLVKDAGDEVRVVTEQLTRRNGALQYWRASMFSKVPGEQFVIRWVLNPEGNIIGAGFGPKSQAKAD